jgi:hypothetical protein
MVPCYVYIYFLESNDDLSSAYGTDCSAGRKDNPDPRFNEGWSVGFSMAITVTGGAQ